MPMMMADNNWDFSFNEFSADDEELSIDLESFYSILGEDPDPMQSSPEDFPFKNVSQDESAPDFGHHDNSQPHGFQELGRASSLGDEFLRYSFNSEASHSITRGSDGLFESAGNSIIECAKLPSAHAGSPVRSGSGSLNDWISHVSGQETCCKERSGVSQDALSYNRVDSKEIQYEIPNCSTAFSFAAGNSNYASDYTNGLDLNHLNGDTEAQFKHMGVEIHSEYASNSMVTENSDIGLGSYEPAIEKSTGDLVTGGKYSCTSMTISLRDADISSHDVNHTESSICQIPDVVYENSEDYSAVQYCLSADGSLFSDPSSQYMPDCFDLQFMPSSEEMLINMKDENEELSAENTCLNSKMNLSQDARASSFVQKGLNNYSDVKGLNFNHEGSNYVSPTSGNSSSNAGYGSNDDIRSIQLSTCSQSYMSNKRRAICIKDERKDELVAPGICQPNEVVDEAVNDKFSLGVDARVFADKNSRQMLSCFPPFISSKKNLFDAKDENEDLYLASKRPRHCQVIGDELSGRSQSGGGPLDTVSEQLIPSVKQSTVSNKQLDYIKDEKEGKLIQPKSMGSYLSKVSPESIQSNSLDHRSHVDDDTDICILEDISEPVRSNSSLLLGKSLVSTQRYSDSLHNTGVVGMRNRTNDERLIFRVALQDLSQPKSEASPPDGVLTVPLLRHQRIALSWMVQKETASLHCSGGILADDQGLGKTVSTIALILKERPTSSRACQEDMKQSELETLNLDEDDDKVPELDGTKQAADSCEVMSHGSSMKKENAFVQGKGRPAAGTLVVCPTSVLRQWAEELRSKVTSKANLSVLVYHGSNRTKDPCELARYDVVLTTYSIVSMEVPKQPLVDKDDEEKVKPEAHVSPTELSSNKKRKYPPSSDKKCLKDKKAMDGALLESVARPLARVGWFRVVLDEAQSIKNHRTQVARACWGLRAKRRWCLSGTPIQNAVDDLYSYFRFLRYDPYAVYKSFCSTIKVPITRNPTNGYRKLQAVLKTIMLRRTKGTLLDGEPIITLPPKSVELKKVDFSKEERDFYSRLEADSRAQFEVYAAAGTVKQNYVNILLMLLRLRQACDHPLLVKGYNSNSVWRSSVEMAKKLSREKQIYLLNCLEGSLAICGICNDPPEDAVVSICGHVFCNQCICEHLTSDENQCPSTNCKVQLNVSSVFSKATLKSSLSDLPVQDISHHCSGSELVEAHEPCPESRLYDSSKIRAALEVLQSLSKPRDCTLGNSSLKSSNETTSGLENFSDSHSEGLLKETCDEKNVVLDKGSITVVGEKAIVFSQWTRMLDLLESCLKNSSIQYRRLDGTMSVVARDKAVKDFNTLPEVSVMIMSLKAASLGLNMVAACHVLLLDLWWNPTTEDQAIDRAHRIGQTRPVTVLRLTVKDTVEDRILALQQKKREMVASAFGEDETGSRQTRLTVDDLKYLFMV